MTNHKDSDRRLLDGLFDFLFPGDEGMTRAEVQEDLGKRGLATGPVIEKVMQAVRVSKERSEARAVLKVASARRQAMLDRIAGIAAEKTEALKEGIRCFVAERFAGTEQAVYMRKLESAASEEDLVSLLDDLAKLEAMSDGPADKP